MYKLIAYSWDNVYNVLAENTIFYALRPLNCHSTGGHINLNSSTTAHIQDQNLVMVASADVLATDGAQPSTVTVMPVIDTVTSFKTQD